MSALSPWDIFNFTSVLLCDTQYKAPASHIRGFWFDVFRYKMFMPISIAL